MDDTSLLAVRSQVHRLAAVIDAPANLLPTYMTSEGSGRPHIEREGEDLCYVVSERGEEYERKRTTSQDELLYWIFRDVTFSMATSWEAANPKPDEDFRCGLFMKQLELLERLDADWAARYRVEKAPRLPEVDLV